MAENLHQEPDLGAQDQGNAAPEPNVPEVSLLEVVQEQLKFQAQHRPYATLAAAAAVGYVLGGGVPSWAVRTATSIGSRILVARVMAAVVGEE